MTNEELTARQLHNINNAIFGIGVALRRHLEAVGAEVVQDPAITLKDFDATMQSYADTLQRITIMVQHANHHQPSGIILPN